MLAFTEFIQFPTFFQFICCYECFLYFSTVDTCIFQVNLAQETLRGILAHWSAKRKQRFGSQASSNGGVPSGKDISIRNHSHSRVDVDDGVENFSAIILPSFEFSTVSPPSIITEGSHGGPWRKKITELDGTEDEKDLPRWCLDCVLNGRLPTRENNK